MERGEVVKGIIKKLSKHWTLVWLIVSLIALCSFLVFADYTGINSIKRVVSTQAPNGVLFSSNSLKATTGNSTFSSAQRLSACQYDITVCNYEQIKATKPNSEEIRYNFIVSLQVRYDGRFLPLSSNEIPNEQKDEYLALLNNRSYTITMIKDDGSGDTTGTGTKINLVTKQGYTYTFENCGLKKEVLSTDMFSIMFDEAELANGHTEPDFYIAVKADPISPSGIAPIHNLYCAAQSAQKASAWEGKLLEADDCETVDYDFYNYIISGSGNGTIDVKWDSTMFEINPFFKDMEGVNIVGTVEVDTSPHSDGHTWKKMTLSVDSTQANRYDIQLYKINETIHSYTGENKASKYVKCVFKSDINNQNNG